MGRDTGEPYDEVIDPITPPKGLFEAAKILPEPSLRAFETVGIFTSAYSPLKMMATTSTLEPPERHRTSFNLMDERDDS